MYIRYKEDKIHFTTSLIALINKILYIHKQPYFVYNFTLAQLITLLN